MQGDLHLESGLEHVLQRRDVVADHDCQRFGFASQHVELGLIFSQCSLERLWVPRRAIRIQKIVSLRHGIHAASFMANLHLNVNLDCLGTFLRTFDAYALHFACVTIHLLRYIYWCVTISEISVTSARCSYPAHY